MRICEYGECQTESEELMERALIGQARVIDGSLARLQTALGWLVQDLSLMALDEGERAPSGSFHPLYGPSATAGYLSFSQPVRAQCWHRDWFGVVLPLSGRARLEQYPAACVSVKGPILVLPASDQSWQFSRGSELILFQFRPPEGSVERLAQIFRDGGSSADSALMDHVKSFMQSLPVLLHPGLPESELQRRLGVLRGRFLALCGIEADVGPAPEPPGQYPLDRRVERVAQQMRRTATPEFDLDELCALAPMSQRGLYYVFRRNLGCSLYQYFKACQLVRARIAVLCDRERRHPISWHAARQGFRHMSRFAAHYRRQFGENPSETLDRLDQEEETSQLLR